MPFPNLRLNRRRISAAIALLMGAAGGLLSACTSYQLSDRSINFNDALQDLDNRQVLLNAVRASKNYPSYFTSVSQVTSTGELDGSQLNLTLPFGPLGHNAFVANPMIKVTTGLTMATNPLDTQDFYEGYMGYVKLSLMQTYFYSGWYYPLLYHAFFQEVDLPRSFIQGLESVAADDDHARCTDNKLGVNITKFVARPTDPVDSDGRPHDCVTRGSLKVSGLSLVSKQLNGTCPDLDWLNDIPTQPADPAASSSIVKIHNNPSNSCEFAKFQLLMAIFDAVNLKISKQTSDPAAASPPLTIPTSDQDVSIKVQSGTATAAADDSKYGFSFDEPATVCGTPKSMTETKMDKKTHTMTVPAPQPTFLIPNQNQAPAPTLPAPPVRGLKTPSLKAQLAAKPAKPSCPTAGTAPLIVTRSPEAIVYYLGQLIKADQDAPDPDSRPQLDLGGKLRKEPLFLVHRGTSPSGPAVVSVELDGETYYIPRDDDYNNSMHFLTLVEQLIALQKKGTQLPTIPTVQVLNQ